MTKSRKSRPETPVPSPTPGFLDMRGEVCPLSVVREWLAAPPDPASDAAPSA